jgi:predicted phage-related endonuclease
MKTPPEPIFVADENTPEWDDARLLSVGASEAAAAAGMKDSYRQPADVYWSKCGKSEDFTDNDAVELGKLLEPVVLDRVLKYEPARDPRYPVGMYRMADHPYVSATPDALVYSERVMQVCPCELKTSCGFYVKILMESGQMGDEETDECPTDWLVQAQQQLLVMNMEVAIVAVLIDGRKLKRFHVEADAGIHDILIASAKEMIERVEHNDPPEVNYEHRSAVELTNRIYDNVDSGLIVPASEEFVAMWEWQKTQYEEEKRFKAERAITRAKCKEEIGDNFGVELPDGRIVRRKEIHKKEYTVKPSSYVDMREIKGK